MKDPNTKMKIFPKVMDFSWVSQLPLSYKSMGVVFFLLNKFSTTFDVVVWISTKKEKYKVI